MSEFKFACPVCGQHIKCATDKSGSQMECPTCFRKLVVPNPPADSSSAFVITASEVHTRTIPLPGSTTNGKSATPPPARKAPVLAVVIGLVVCGAAAGVVVFRGKIFPSHDPVAPGNSTVSQNDIQEPVTPVPPEPPPGDDRLWLTNLAGTTIPETPASGRISGRGFAIQRAAIKGGQLDLRQGAKWPPDVGLSVYLFANQAEDLAGKTVNIEPDREKSPRVLLRTKDERGQAVNKEFRQGYAMRLEFGPASGGKISGRIYFCAPDDGKSYVVGTFNAEIRKPNPPKPKPAPPS